MVLNNWFGSAGWTCNHLVASIDEGTPSFVKNLWVKLINNAKFEDKPWVMKAPYDTWEA